MQFTLKDLLRCMTLIALGIIGLTVITRIDWGSIDRHTTASGIVSNYVVPIALFLFFGALVPAGIGALVQRARLGFYIGAAIIFVAFAVFTLPNVIFVLRN